MIPRFDWSLNFGHLLTMLTVLGAGLIWLSRFRQEQFVHNEQLKGFAKWIADHDRDLKENMEAFRELQLQAALTTQLLQALVMRVERLESRGAAAGGNR